MTGKDLCNELTKRWQTYCDEDVYISIGDELVSLADIDYNDEDKRFVLIPEAKEPPLILLTDELTARVEK